MIFLCVLEKIDVIEYIKILYRDIPFPESGWYWYSKKLALNHVANWEQDW